MISLRDSEETILMTSETAVEKGVVVDATACITDDCQKGIAKFLEK